MARRSAPDGGSRGDGESASPRPFAGLKSVVQASPRDDAAKRGAPPPERPAPDEAALFRREVRGTTPLRDTRRRELERPKPAPTPRPRDPADESPVTPGRPGGSRSVDGDLLAEAMRGVRPLADTHRVDLAGPKREREIRESPEPPTGPPPPGADEAQWLAWGLAGVTPLKSGRRADVDGPRPAPEPIQRERDEHAALRESIETPLSLEDRLDTGDETTFLRPGLPRRVLGDLRRGRWVIQRELDLHGMTRDEARAALAAFLAACLADAHRCVRLIHGKGLGSPGRVGILKQLSRGWLAQREEILAFCEARPHDGGSGALLILLRASGARDHRRR